MESVFAIIAEPNRRAILSLLVSSQQSVGEIERRLRMPQPTVSKHLRVLGEAEMLGAVLLVVPAAAQWMPILTPLAAAALALETLALAGLYARYSLKLAATNPMVWAVVMGLLSAFVAYGRYA